MSLTLLIILGLITTGVGIYADYDLKRMDARDLANTTMHKLADNAGIDLTKGKYSAKEFEAFINNAIELGYINYNTNEYRDALKAYDKLRQNNWDISELDKSEAEALTKMSSDLYNNYPEFHSLWDKTYDSLTEEEKMRYLAGANNTAVPIPAPNYFDTNIKNYQKEVEPLKFYTNKELADIYNIDYDYDSIKKDLDNAAEAEVAYRNWQSNLLANAAERNNTQAVTDYLDAIRKTKSDAVISGISSGARAAAENLASRQAMQNKAAKNLETATQRFETMDNALLQRASTGLQAQQVYDQLAQTLSNAGVTLYGNDVNRRGQDLLSNANFYSADENLRSNMAAQNNLMSAMYNAAQAQNQGYLNALNANWDYFKNISLPANDYNFNAALADYMNLAYQQNTHYYDQAAKWSMLKNDE